MIILGFTTSMHWAFSTMQSVHLVTEGYTAQLVSLTKEHTMQSSLRPQSLVAGLTTWVSSVTKHYHS